MRIYHSIPRKPLSGQADQLLTALHGRAFIAGGYARYVTVNDAPEPQDIDLFLYREANEQVVKDILTGLGYDMTADKGQSLIYANDQPLPVQLICSGWGVSWGTPEEVISGFAYTTEMFALYREDSRLKNQIAFGDHAEIHTTTRELHINYIACPVHVAWRAIKKYGPKGYTMSGMEFLRLFKDWEGRSEEEKERTAETIMQEYCPMYDAEGNILPVDVDDLPF